MFADVTQTNADKTEVPQKNNGSYLCSSVSPKALCVHLRPQWKKIDTIREALSTNPFKLQE